MSRRLKVKSARNGNSPPRARSSGNPFPAETTPSPRWLTIAICLFLAAAVWAVFGQTRHHEFLNFDDNLYVYENPAITQGLTGDGIVWAFTHSLCANWHPLTTLSHMLDCQLWGLDPGGHHLTNVLFHGATAILLFLMLRKLTGAFWPSAILAAVFSIHPLRVESVAWVAERKDVLSGFFFMLTLGAYGCYARQFQAQRAKAKVWYGLALGFFTLGLLSKPMLVTTPFILLLLDYWPLQRIERDGFRMAAGWRLVAEKIPFFALAAGDCAATIWAQNEVIKSAESLGFTSRIGEAVVAYTDYLVQMFYPVGLAIFYPHPENQLSIWKVILSLLVLIIISAGVLAGRRRQPYLLVGWLWYLGMLVPVIGILQVGGQARADRYTYLPQIGLYLLVIWWVADFCGKWRHRRAVLGSGAVAMLATLLVLAQVQTTYWKDNLTLWRHTLACTSGNYLAHNNLGLTLAAQGKLDEAIEQYLLAIQLKPYYADAHNNLGMALADQGKLPEATRAYDQALQLKPDRAEFHNNLANALTTQGQVDEAIQHYEQALQLRPDYADAHYNLGLALANRRKWDAAIQHYQLARQLKPDYVEVQNSLGNALAAQGKLPEAIRAYDRALQLKPDYVSAHNNLAIVLADQGKLDEAVLHYSQALQLKPDHANAHYNLGIALARQGRLDESLQHFQQALTLATAQNNPALAEAVRTRLKAYESALSQPQTK